MKDRRLGNYNKQEYYYLDDIDEIRSVFSEWKDLKKIPVFPRYFDSGFSCDFYFYLIIDGKAQPCPIDGISPDCELIEINRQGYEYNIEYWKRLQSKLKPAKKEEAIICKNAIEYRKILDEKQKDKNYLFSENNFSYYKQSVPEKYDGYFYITTNNSSFSSIESKISKAYPDADFRIGEQLGGGLFRFCDFQIYAFKEFYEKFNLYPKNEYTEFNDIKLTVYLKE
ncbi:hypothetical protein [Treponema sp.]|uniref:hypothetical protein n=1 Tax=Treponema sp. TaxID=166 RepID=UPI00298EB5E5|nr:hypothetical protein [Treponema sp.]MCR5613663.1 hypothetical protein [Treponema sp.]